MLAEGRDDVGDVAHERHQPEQILLYQLVKAHYAALVDQLVQQGKSLPDHVRQEFEAYLKCGRLEHGFLDNGFVNHYFYSAVSRIQGKTPNIPVRR